MQFFQHPFFPNSGADNAAANMKNIPVDAYTKEPAIRDLGRDKWLPKLRAHQPELILVSASFDAHREDRKAESSAPWKAATTCPLWVAALWRIYARWQSCRIIE